MARDIENTAETAEATGESSVRQRKIKRSVLRKISHLLPEVLLKKSELCKHDHGCFENTTRSMLRYFLFGFTLQMALKNVLLIAKPAKIIKGL